MKHWTTEICDKHLAEGYRYTVFDRHGKGKNMAAPCRTFAEVFEVLEKRYPKLDFGSRFAFLPDSHKSPRHMSLMYYEDDGTFHCYGSLVANGEPDENYSSRTGYENTDAGVLNVQES
jgi:hypothetical protein